MTKFTSRRYAFAALLFWIVFTVGGVAGMVKLFVRIVCQLVKPSERNGFLIHRGGKALDNFNNTQWWFDGHPQETISSHAGRMWMKGDRRWQLRVLKWLLETAFRDKGHLENAIEEPFRN